MHFCSCRHAPCGGAHAFSRGPVWVVFGDVIAGRRAAFTETEGTDKTGGGERRQKAIWPKHASATSRATSAFYKTYKYYVFLENDETTL